jgi:enoyl-CoA hydratase/carnithine racemase
VTERNGDQVKVQVGPHALIGTATEGAVAGPVTVIVRPEAIVLDAPGGLNRFNAKVTDVTFLGNACEMTLDMGGIGVRGCRRPTRAGWETRSLSSCRLRPVSSCLIPLSEVRFMNAPSVSAATFDFKVRIDGALARIDLNRPDEGNTLTLAMMKRLAQLVRELDANPAVGVIALEARGQFFSRGRDGTGESPGELNAYEMREKLLAPILDLYTAVASASVPVVSCVQGPALGFGAAMAGACDITLASDKAHFSFPEINHGIAPTLAMAGVMRKIAPKAMTYLIYSGREISASEAVTCGLASTVFPDAVFAVEAEKFLKEMTGRKRLVLETIKRFQTNANGLSPAMTSEYAGTLMALVRTVK